MAHVVDPTAHRGVEAGEARPPGLPGIEAGPEPAGRLDHLAPLHPAMGRIDDEADAALNTQRLYLRLAHRWHWLSDGQYEHVSKMVAEIGRLLGGWIRQERAALGKEDSGRPARTG